MRKRDTVGTVVDFLLLLWVFLMLPSPRLLHALDQAAGSSCVTTTCHASMGKAAVVHPPVAGVMCESCHAVSVNPQRRTKHPQNMEITLVRQGADLCGMCHAPKGTRKVVHAPIIGGDCTSCHDPHQSPHRGMMKAPLPELCFQCHDDRIRSQAHMHPPVAAGDCSSCHDNHESDHPARLVAEGNALCFMCHPDKEEGLKTKLAAHVPVQASCVQCHNPHGAAAPAMLSAPVPDLCANCHPNVVLQRQRAVTKHAPMADQKSCRNCHEPHYSDQPKLLITAQMALCLACHDRELETGSGTIADMKSLLARNKNAHGPLQGRDCVSCHAPHGSDYWRILVKYYPADFYTSYSDGKYALCFSCHDRTAFTERLTVTATNFRDGDRNLHFVHVNKMAKGRTCRSCHEVHADNGRPHHMKELVQFSGWTMPMNYAPGRNGGSCLPGCHGEQRYRR